MACFDSYPEGIGDLRQQTHNDEFGGTDRECTKRQCQKGGSLLKICGSPPYVANVSAARRSVPMRGRTQPTSAEDPHAAPIHRVDVVGDADLNEC